MNERTDDMPVGVEDAANSPVACYVPTEKSVENGWFVSTCEEIKFLFTTREGLLGNYESVYHLMFPCELALC